MSLSDPIGDMIARIKNAQLRNHKVMTLPSSKFKVKLADVLKNEGFIIDYKIESKKMNTFDLLINLKYIVNVSAPINRTRTIKGISAIS